MPDICIYPHILPRRKRTETIAVKSNDISGYQVRLGTLVSLHRRSTVRNEGITRLLLTHLRITNDCTNLDRVPLHLSLAGMLASTNRMVVHLSTTHQPMDIVACRCHQLSSA